MKVMSLELNEINFDFVKKYVDNGYLPNFKTLLDKCFFANTVSEKEYEHLEPWIQWVTVYTGKSYSEHGVFRLGDAVLHDHEQIWEVIERETGKPVVVFSPMNAPNRVGENSIFIPDPWINTPVTGNVFHRLAYSAIRQAVNDNATKGASVLSMVKLGLSLLPVAGRLDYAKAWSYLKRSKDNKWFKAILLDYLLFELFSKTVEARKPEYASLFLNAGAHIQHHYMFDSAVYSGGHKNPINYRAKGDDPILQIYSLYDEVLGKALEMYADYRIIITTGLSQRPNPDEVYYYRPVSHANLLEKIGVSYVDVNPRMSRDMLITFESDARLKEAIDLLDACKVLDVNAEVKLFSLEVREKSIFCKVAYTGASSETAVINNSSGQLGAFGDYFSHVSIENGIHRTLGFVVDAGRGYEELGEPLPLTQVNQYVKGLAVGLKAA